MEQPCNNPKINIMKNLDSFLFKQADTLVASAEFNKVSEAYSSQEDKVQEIIKVILMILTVGVPTIIVIVFLGLNNSKRNQIEVKEELIETANLLIQQRSLLSSEERRTLSSKYIDSQKALRSTINSSLNLISIESTKVQISDFQSDDLEGLITKASAKVSFKGLTSEGLMAFFNNLNTSLSKEQKLRRNESCDLNAEKLANLSLTLAPNQQVLSVENSLRSIFREHVEMVKDSGEITDESILLILNASSENGSNILVRNSLNTQQVYEDAMTAMSITRGNLENFWKNFSKSIVRVLKKLKEEKNDFLIGKICVSAATSPITKMQKRKIQKFCAGSVYKSTSRKIKDLKYSDIVNLDFKDKACDLYNFRRKLNILNNQ